MIHIAVRNIDNTSENIGVFSSFDSAVEFLKRIQTGEKDFYTIESWLLDVPGTSMVSFGSQLEQNIDAERDGQ